MNRREDSRHSPNFPTQFVLLSALFVALVAAVTWTVVSRSQSRLIEFKALKIAEIVADQASTARSVYSELAVAKLVRDGLGASADSDGLKGHVPLPAQFVKQLSRRTLQDADGLYRFKPISLWNLDPDQGIVDDFQRWAWAELEAQDRPAPSAPIDWRPAWRIERVDGVETLRYLRADPAASASCVDCHNALEQRPETVAARRAAGVEPGHRWELDELMGAVEIEVPLARAAALADSQTQHGLMVIAAVTLVGLAGVCILVFLYSSRTRVMTAELTRQARRDSLTGLPNRLDLERALGELLGTGLDGVREHAVMLLDLDDFKRINDTLGHEAGDEVLVLTGRRIQHALRVGDFVARLGGDEFAVVLIDADRERAREVAARIAAAMERVFQVGEHRLVSGASVGIAMVPGDGREARELLRRADVAMYVAKNDRLPCAFYDPAQDDHHVSALALTRDLREAVRTGGLSLHYQPKYDLREGRMTGVEALLRWHHPAHGHVAPDVAIAIAERCGLMGELTRWVLVSALGQCRLWRDAGYELGVAVNLSASNLHDAGLVEQIVGALADGGLPASALVLEVTEGAVMRDPERARRTLLEIERHGVTLSVDDYGTGYCSLSYLSRLPVRELKLDRSFIGKLFDGDKDEVIVRATVELAHNLGLSMVAEGVEDARTLEYLCGIGCDVAQGYFLCRPVSAEALTARLPASYRFSPRARADGPAF